MNFSENHIIDYLDGNLIPEDVRLFEEQLRTDPDLKEALQAQQLVGEAMEFNHDEHLKATFATWQEERKKKEETNVKKFSIHSRWLAIAAGLIIVIAATFLFTRQSSPDILASYYTEPLHGITRDFQGTDVTETYAAAIKLYANDEYQLAINGFQAVVESDPNFENSKLMITDCFIKMRNWESALSAANSNLKLRNASLLFLERMEWTKMLLLIESKQKTSATELLDEIISNPQHLFYVKASTLKSELSL